MSFTRAILAGITTMLVFSTASCSLINCSDFNYYHKRDNRVAGKIAQNDWLMQNVITVDVEHIPGNDFLTVFDNSKTRILAEWPTLTASMPAVREAAQKFCNIDKDVHSVSIAVNVGVYDFICDEDITSLEGDYSHEEIMEISSTIVTQLQITDLKTTTLVNERSTALIIDNLDSLYNNWAQIPENVREDLKFERGFNFTFATPESAPFAWGLHDIDRAFLETALDTNAVAIHGDQISSTLYFEENVSEQARRENVEELKNVAEPNSINVNDKRLSFTERLAQSSCS